MDIRNSTEGKLAADQHIARKSRDKGGMDLIFVCPRTNLHVHHRMDRTSARDHEYEAVACPACLRLHFINSNSGELLGHEASNTRDRDPLGGSGANAPERPHKAAYG
jgi:hypothetical protein